MDVRRLQEVAIDPHAQRVRVGAGVKWERVVPRLSEHGLAALHGSSPDVGIAGYSLGGGMGWLARKHGLQANSVTAMELVTADGGHRRVDASHEPDLFWALRGGNGNYGVVTAIEFRVYPVEDLYAGAMFFPFERTADVLGAFTELTPGRAGRAHGVDHAPAVPGRALRARAVPGRLVRRRYGRLPGRRGRGPRAAARGPRPGAGHGHVRDGAARRAQRAGHGPAGAAAGDDDHGPARRRARRGADRGRGPGLGLAAGDDPDPADGRRPRAHDARAPGRAPPCRAPTA